MRKRKIKTNNCDEELVAKWQEDNGVEIGDIVMITNCGGDKYVGKLIKIDFPLCRLQLANDDYFPFSPYDCNRKKGTIEKAPKGAKLSYCNDMNFPSILNEFMPVSRMRKTEKFKAW